MKKEEQYFYEVGEMIDESIKGQMFGKPCFKIGKKAFTCFFQSAMVFKLSGDAHQEALSFDGSKLFDPSGKGRAMKEWVQVPFDYKKNWKLFAEKAAEYVASSL